VRRRIGIIAAGGESRRTGLGEYTSKAALPLRGISLLAHQIDFLRRSSASCAYVIARLAHARLLGEVLSPVDRAFVSFILSDCSTGWGGEVARAERFVQGDDEVVLVSCDNDHDLVAAPVLCEDQVAMFTFTTWSRTDRSPTDGSVLARSGAAWVERGGPGFVGDFFSGYAVVRGRALVETLRDTPAIGGKREFTALLARLAHRSNFRARPYGGAYEDVRDLRALALLDAGASSWADAPVDIGAGALLHDDAGRVLLSLRQDGRGWTLPGGHVEAGEMFVRAAAREVAEEVGIAIEERDMRLLGVYTCVGKTGNPACSVIFHARGEPAKCVARDPEEVLRVDWFDRAAAAKVTVPFALRGAVDDWFAGRELDVR
jgi:8-oxo-dGTP diphosphatase